MSSGAVPVALLLPDGLVARLRAATSPSTPSALLVLTATSTLALLLLPIIYLALRVASRERVLATAVTTRFSLQLVFAAVFALLLTFCAQTLAELQRSTEAAGAFVDLMAIPCGSLAYVQVLGRTLATGFFATLAAHLHLVSIKSEQGARFLQRWYLPIVLIPTLVAVFTGPLMTLRSLSFGALVRQPYCGFADDMRGDVFIWKWILVSLWGLLIMYALVVALGVWARCLWRRRYGKTSLPLHEEHRGWSALYAFLLPVTQAGVLAQAIVTFVALPRLPNGVALADVPVESVPAAGILYWTVQFIYASTGLLLLIAFLADPATRAMLCAVRLVHVTRYVMDCEEERSGLLAWLHRVWCHVAWLYGRDAHRMLAKWRADEERVRSATLHARGVKDSWFVFQTLRGGFPQLRGPSEDSQRSLIPKKAQADAHFLRAPRPTSDASSFFIDVGRPTPSIIGGPSRSPPRARPQHETSSWESERGVRVDSLPHLDHSSLSSIDWAATERVYIRPRQQPTPARWV